LKHNDFDLSWKSIFFKSNLINYYYKYLFTIEFSGKLIDIPYNGATKSINSYLFILSSVINMTYIYS